MFVARWRLVKVRRKEMLADLEDVGSSSSDGIIDALGTLKVGSTTALTALKARHAALDVFQPPCCTVIGLDRHS